MFTLGSSVLQRSCNSTEMIAIHCHDYSKSFRDLAYLYGETLCKNNGYKFERCKYELTIDLTINGKNVRIMTSRRPMKHCDVCVVGSWISSADFSAKVKQQASWCKEQYPEAPIIVVGDAWLRYDSAQLKSAALAGRKTFNKTMGNRLAQDLSAVKYIECSYKSGRGLKILIDEIVFAYFSKLSDEEEQQEREKKEADEIRREKTKQSLFMLEKFLDVLHYI